VSPLPRGLLLIVAAMAPASAWLELRPPPRGDLPSVSAESPSRARIRQQDLDSIVRHLVVRTPFRAARAPSGAAYDPDHQQARQDAPPVAPKPVLTLSGVVWGSEPLAVVDGFPGVEGSKVVRQGEVVGKVKVKRIERERVYLTGLDTAWILPVRAAWQ
jgi:hypothetical protein